MNNICEFWPIALRDDNGSGLWRKMPELYQSNTLETNGFVGIICSWRILEETSTSWYLKSPQNVWSLFDLLVKQIRTCDASGPSLVWLTTQVFSCGLRSRFQSERRADLRAVLAFQTFLSHSIFLLPNAGGESWKAQKCPSEYFCSFPHPPFMLTANWGASVPFRNDHFCSISNKLLYNYCGKAY